MKKLEIFDTARVVRDAYGEFVKKNEAARKAELAAAKKTFLPGKPLAEKTAEINTKYDKEKRRMKDSIMAQFDEAYDKVTKETSQKVARIDVGRIGYLRALEDFNISSTEYAALAGKFAGDYWSDRCLQWLASKNGITPNADDFDPPADVITATLEELRANVLRFLASAGSGNYMEIQSLHDSTIKRLEDRLLPGQDPGFSPKQKAQRFLLDIAGAGHPFAQAQMIRNVLATAEDSVRRQFLLGLESGEYHIFEDAIRSSGADRVIDLEKKTNVQNAKRASEAVSQLKALGSIEENWLSAQKILLQAGGAGNDQLYSAVTDAFGSDNKAALEILERAEVKPPVQDSNTHSKVSAE